MKRGTEKCIFQKSCGLRRYSAWGKDRERHREENRPRWRPGERPPQGVGVGELIELGAEAKHLVNAVEVGVSLALARLHLLIV